MSSTINQAAESLCAGCGEPVTGNFCSHCGERREHHIFSVSGLMHDLFHTLTHADGTIFRTLLTLLREPGLLTRAYFLGPRRRYLGPVQLFLICNVIFFIAQSAIGLSTFSSPFKVQMNMQSYSSYIQPAGQRFLAVAQTPQQRAELIQKFDDHTEHLSKEIVIVLVPVFAALVGLTFLGTGRKYVEHLVFSLHFYSFFLIVVLAAVGAMFCVLPFLTRAHVAPSHIFELGSMAILISVSTIYLVPALRHYYELSWAQSVWRACTLALTLIPLIVFYRWFLFYATIWTL